MRIWAYGISYKVKGEEMFDKEENITYDLKRVDLFSIVNNPLHCSILSYNNNIIHTHALAVSADMQQSRSGRIGEFMVMYEIGKLSFYDL